MSDIAIYQDETQINLPELAEQINNEHMLCETAMRETLTHALEAGRLLHQAKVICKHGTWLEWVKDNCRFSDRTAQNYMRLADRFPELEKAQRVADLSYREAVRLLAEPREPIEDTQTEKKSTDVMKALDVFSALTEIRDKKLYRDTHQTFEDYCRDRWKIENINELMEVFGVFKEQQYELHDLCNLFPWDERAVNEITRQLRNGTPLYSPITLYEGKILDGKLRYEACKRAGITPTFNKFPDDYPDYRGDASDFVYAANVLRKHLTPVELDDLLERQKQLHIEMGIA